MRVVTWLFVAVGALPVCAAPRVVILGFDGVEPALVEAMIDKGELPNLAKLKAAGSYARLGTTVPPLSPVAWASFATCKQPTVHGVFDFMARKPDTYALVGGEGRLEQPKLGADGAVATPARYVPQRKGDAFWLEADRQGKRCKIIHVPFAFPVDPLARGAMLGGEGVPDIRGNSSFSFWMSDTYTPEQLRESTPGGVRFALKFENDVATVRIPTARDPRPGRPQPVLPIALRVDRSAHTVVAQLPTGPVTLKQGEWSDWLEWSFNITPKYAVRAISRFYLIEAGDHVRLYMSSMQQHPLEPLVPISTPPAYSAELVNRYGLFKTLGWSHDTNALKKDALPEDVFLDEARAENDWKERLTLEELDRSDFDLLISCWTATDRVAHMFWRFRDPKHPLYSPEGAAKYGTVVEEMYRRMDQTVGRVISRLAPDDLLMILSDHGFHSFRTGFNVTTWLVRNGYLAVEGQTDPAIAINDKAEFTLEGYDWSRSKAYSVGLSGIYVNLSGREAKGIVPKEEMPGLLHELRDKLLQVVNPATGEKVFSEIYITDNAAGPDIQLGYAEGYQTSKIAARGAAPAELFAPNDDKWSGDHASSAANQTKGIFFANKPLPGANQAEIIDLGPTALSYLGLTAPAAYQGKSLQK